MTTSKAYSVNYWGSHPDAGNDDCWTGRDFDTREEAENVFLSEFKGLPGTPSRDVAWIELDGPAVHRERANPGFRPSRDDDSAERSERAMQAGMAGGCDWYNDEMGY